MGSNPIGSTWKLGQVRLDTIKAVGSFYRVSMREEVKYPKQGVNV